MQSWIVLTIVIVLQGQQLPAAPEPKATPAPFKVPASASPMRTPMPDVEKDKTEKADEDLGDLGVSKELLRGPEGSVLKDFLKNRLRPTIMRHWEDVMPEEAKEHRSPLVRMVKKGKTGTVRVSFTVHKDGAITDIVVDDSSGDRLLDEAAMKAVKASQPLTLPAAFTKDQLKIAATFMYNPKHRPRG
jgi:protein TonB